jgi:serine protease Do
MEGVEAMNGEHKRYHWSRLCGLIACTLLLAAALSGCNSTAQAEQAKVTPADQRPVSTLRDLSEAFVDIAAEIKPAVVTVSTERTVAVGQSPFASPFEGSDLFDFFFGQRGRGENPHQQEYRQRGLGSGVVVTARGDILTNHHVIANADSIYVTTYDGRRLDAEVVGSDAKTDLAVIKVKSDGLNYMEMGNSDSLQVGEMVLAIGSPMSENLALTVTQGIVSAKGRSNIGLAQYEDFIQTDAAINPGNSGGPLVNLDGKLIGINTAIISQSGGSQGIGFAVPSSMAVGVMNQLISNGKVVRGWLGVYVQDVTEAIANAIGLDQPRGAIVSDVVKDSPAQTAGLKVGDVITQIDGQELSNASDLSNRIASTTPGTDVEITLLRDGKEQTVSVKLGELPSEEQPLAARTDVEQELGFSVETLTKDQADRMGLKADVTGVLVTAIDAMGVAYRNGLRQGDVITSVDRQDVSSADEFNNIVAAKNKGDSILLRVRRQGRSLFIAFRL